MSEYTVSGGNVSIRPGRRGSWRPGKQPGGRRRSIAGAYCLLAFSVRLGQVFWCAHAPRAVLVGGDPGLPGLRRGPIGLPEQRVRVLRRCLVRAARKIAISHTPSKTRTTRATASTGIAAVTGIALASPAV